MVEAISTWTTWRTKTWSDEAKLFHLSPGPFTELCLCSLCSDCEPKKRSAQQLSSELRALWNHLDGVGMSAIGSWRLPVISAIFRIERNRAGKFSAKAYQRQFPGSSQHSRPTFVFDIHNPADNCGNELIPEPGKSKAYPSQSLPSCTCWCLWKSWHYLRVIRGGQAECLYENCDKLPEARRCRLSSERMQTLTDMFKQWWVDFQIHFAAHQDI